MPDALLSKVAHFAAVLLFLTAASCATSSASTSDASATAEAEKRGGETQDSTGSAGDGETPQTEWSTASLASNLPEGANPYEGVVTAGQPSKAQFRRIAETDIETVVNFRSPEEEGTWDEESLAGELGLNYVHIPIRSPSDLDRQHVERFAEVLENQQGDVLVHCGSSNRVGAMLALRAYWLENESADRAIQIGMRAGLTSLKSAVRQKMNE